MKKLFAFLAIGFSMVLHAQQEPEDIAAVTDSFQDAFFESLTQKGIENYDRAITALEKCKELQPNNPAVYNELGKNYQGLKDYKKAYDAFEKASQLDPKNMWPLVGMYDVLYEWKDYQKAIEIVQRLILFKKEYREELVSLYMMTHQFDKALDLINELNDQVGKSDMRENYKAQILKDPKYQGVERANLLEQIKKDPKNESNYLALMKLYSESGQDDKAMEIARKLEKEVPTSEWAQVNLFQSFLASGEGEKALTAMNVVFASRKIDNKIKHRMLNEFLIYAKDKPQFDADIEKAIQNFTSEREIQIAREVGKFYHEKGNWDRALRYYELQLRSNPDDSETALLQLEVYLRKGQGDLLAEKAEQLIELFPLEPQYYLYAGQGYNLQKNYNKAKSILADGSEYVVDNPQMEAAFFYELSTAHNGLGDQKTADSYKTKADQLVKGRKK